MAKTPKAVTPKAGENPGRIIDIDVASEMSESFLEYAYSVIYSRALPDARDGLKPVQRRILHQMNEILFNNIIIISKMKRILQTTLLSALLSNTSAIQSHENSQ